MLLLIILPGAAFCHALPTTDARRGGWSWRRDLPGKAISPGVAVVYVVHWAHLTEARGARYDGTMPKEPITLERLARMVAAGFAEIKADIAGLATKAELAEFRAEVNVRFEQVDARFEHQAASLAYLTDRVDRIGQRLGEDHRRRIERLEADVQRLKAKAGLR